MIGEDHAIGLLYEAAVVPALWPAALTAFARAFDCIDASLVVQDMGAGVPLFLRVGGEGLDPGLMTLYVDHYVQFDPMALVTARAAHPAGSVVLSQALIDEADRARNPFFQELLIPGGGAHYGGWMLASEGERRVGLSLHRRDRVVDREVILGATRLARHAARAADLARIVGEREALRATGGRAAVSLGLKWMIVDDEATLLDQAPSAHPALATPGLIGLDRRRRLTFGDEASTARLRRLVAQACAGAAGGVVDAGRAAETVRLFVAPAGSAAENPFSPAHGSRALVVMRTRADEAADADRFRQAIGCSPAEAYVAAALAAGRAPSEVARERGASLNTVRTQIRALFDITGTRRLAALVAVLSRV